MCCQDSGLPSASSPAAAARRPARSRRTASTGCTIVWIDSPQPFSTTASESTRNGMSSVTTSTTVRGDCQPSRDRSGLKTRTSARPGLRTAPKRR